jgi:ATP-dependent Lon protease
MDMDHKDSFDAPGFEMHTLEDPEGCFPSCRLYLPIDLAQSLRESKEQVLREQQRRRQEQEEPATRTTSRAARATPASIDIEAERANVRVPDPDSYRGSSYPVYDPYAPVDMLARSRTMSDKRDQERIETIYKQLAAKRSNLRPIKWPTDIPSELGALAERLPHFKEVTEFVRGRLEVASDYYLLPRVPPILLTGDPGLGKTHYCRALAEVLRTTVRVQPYDNAETTSQLLGSDRHWGNTHHGILFDLLALGSHANPILVLDELDKARSRHTQMDPLAPLHSILEPSTACALRDLSLEFTLDASLVTFIATANDEKLIPQTLLSRFRVFEILQPQGADAIAFAHEVLCAVLQRWELELPPHSRRLATCVAHLSAREILKAVEDAVTRMLADGRRELLRGDIRLDAGDQSGGWLH